MCKFQPHGQNSMVELIKSGGTWQNHSENPLYYPALVHAEYLYLKVVWINKTH